MKPLPKSTLALLIRTDFSNQQAWDEIREIIKTPVDGFYAYVEYVEDPAYEGLTRDQILDLFRGSNQSYAMIADRVTIEDPDHPLLIIDLFNPPNPEFRAIPSTIQQIENNLSIANLDFSDFANAVDEHGIYRGFPEF
jgi:hypothetical protein